MSTSSPATTDVTPPPLAQFMPVSNYNPRYGDFVVWSGWVRSWFGVVSNVSKNGQVTVIFEGTPALLFTMTQQEMQQNSKVFDIGALRTKRCGSLVFNQHHDGSSIWYV